MSVTRWAGALGVAILVVAWAGPLPGMAAHSFAAHMSLHMLVVAVAAPLVALGLTARGWPDGWGWPSPIAASALELAVVWTWHAPRLHQAARGGGLALAIEQASFLAAGLVLWVAVTAALRQRGGRDAGAAAIALGLTLAHMTLLGALLSLSPRPLYAHGNSVGEALADQQRGGAIMLIASAIAYLSAGLVAGHRLLSAPAPVRTEAT